MSSPHAQIIGLLRTLASHLERRPCLPQRVTQDFLIKEGLGHVRENSSSIICIRVPGHYAFTELANCILDRFPEMERGTKYADVQTELFSAIEAYVGRDVSSIGHEDAESLVVHFREWFDSNSTPRRVFVPCAISQTSAPRFEIGPVAFEFIDQVMASDFCPKELEGERALGRGDLQKLLTWMREWDANWLARVSVAGCERARAEDVAEIAVDLAIVGLQLAAPHLDTRSMARLDARRGTSQKRTLSESNGYFSAGWTRKEPGMTIGRGTLPDILQKASPIFIAVGNVVRSFASGSFRLPVLERAWCDAAYWLHQALVDSSDTIATAKLETALEVLLNAESSRGSEQRMLQILSAFYDLGPDDPIAPGSPVSARQFSRNIVRDRSRILHGTWSTLNARGIDRNRMEGFVTAVLRTAIVELDAYSQIDNPVDHVDQYLDWVRQHKSHTAKHSNRTT